ncbi:unnamed protein product [Camellia sinensis]
MRMQFFKVTAGGARLSDSRSSKKIICDAAAGAAAGAIAATFGCPLDVIKTRLQVHGLPEAHHSSPKGSIIITSLQNIIRTEGLKGLYRGLSPTLVALLPNWASLWGKAISVFFVSSSHCGKTTISEATSLVLVLVLSQQLQQIYRGLLRPDCNMLLYVAEVSKLEPQLENEMKFERKTPFQVLGRTHQAEIGFELCK